MGEKLGERLVEKLVEKLAENAYLLAGLKTMVIPSSLIDTSFGS